MKRQLQCYQHKINPHPSDNYFKENGGNKNNKVINSE